MVLDGFDKIDFLTFSNNPNAANCFSYEPVIPESSKSKAKSILQQITKAEAMPLFARHEVMLLQDKLYKLGQGTDEILIQKYNYTHEAQSNPVLK